MKKIVLLSVLSLCVLFLQAQDMKTYKFAERDTCSLYMDVYQPVQPNGYCIVYVFGGGFIGGERNNEYAVSYAKKLAEKGYVVVCNDYRLGLKGAKMDLTHVISSLENAINLAVEDLLSAISFVLKHADELHVNADKIVLTGSSAGAITVLEADYMQGNRFDLAKVLPEDFHFAGVMSFAGAIFSRNGKVKYRVSPPAPTMFLQGTSDNLVTYKKIRFANYGFFGTKPLVKQFQKFDYPFYARRYEDLGHEAAALHLYEFDLSLWFIDNYVVKKRNLQIDETINDPDVPRWKIGKVKPGQVYNKKR